MPVSIKPEDEKIWKYVVQRKTAVTVKQVRKALLVSETHTKRALEYFVFAGLMDRFQSGSTKFYSVKE